MVDSGFDSEHQNVHHTMPKKRKQNTHFTCFAYSMGIRTGQHECVIAHDSCGYVACVNKLSMLL